MNLRFALLLASTLFGTVAAADPAPPVTKPAVDRPSAAFDLKDRRVQEILRASAASQPATSAPVPADAPALEPFPHRASRKVHRTECDLFACVAYAADGRVLFSIPREQVAHPGRDDAGWLSCQQVDDLLSTFERYDKCRGVMIGLPAKAIDGLALQLPTQRPGAD